MKHTYIYDTINYTFGVLKDDTFIVTDGVKVIGQDAFAGQAFKKIQLPASVETIEKNAFRKCMSLETVTFATGSKLKTIGENAFQYCVSLKEIVLPENVQTIGVSAFDYCESLEKVVLNESLQSIGDYAFRGTTGLKTVTTPSTLSQSGSYFPATVTLGTAAFQMSGLTGKVTFAENMISFKGTDELAVGTSGSEFQHCRNITEVVLPSTFKYITANAFAYCTSLKNVSIPAGLEIVGNSAFKATALESVSLPKVLKNIGSSVFESCTSLKKVVFPSTL